MDDYLDMDDELALVTAIRDALSPEAVRAIIAQLAPGLIADEDARRGVRFFRDMLIAMVEGN